MSLPTNQQKAYQSLLALSVGDATGEAHLGSAPQTEYKAGNVRELRNAMMQEITGYLPWTDDTAMAIGVYRILTKYGTVNQIELAREFARNAKADPQRGYGNGTARLLFTYLYDSENWESQSRNWWGPGVGSKGNGSAMRDSIIGPFFGSDLDRVVSEATASAQVTHWHDDAIAGSVAVAVGAANATYGRIQDFWGDIYEWIPDGEMKEVSHGDSDRQESQLCADKGLAQPHFPKSQIQLPESIEPVKYHK
jgi:ADP-ribosylglycohydrolase